VSAVSQALLAQSKRPAYFVFMVDVSCAKCGAQIVPGTNFCRACGAPVASQAEPSEMKTAVLDKKVVRSTTQRFEARKTAEASTEVPLATYNPGVPAFSPVQAPIPTRSRRGLVIVLAVLVVLLAASGLIGVMKRVLSGRTSIQVSQQYTYPGAHTVLNVGDGGGGVLQMETTDTIDKVSAWYTSTLKPTKTIQVTAATVIMKNDRITVTMVATDQGTSIVIKQSAP
jgi:hypothetical protein